MEIDLQPGKYIVAVSGGVDSMALLHLLQQQPELELVAAHFDHGIREDSVADRLLVEETAKSYGLPYVFSEGKLGKDSSEAMAREARYAFLRRVKTEQLADAIITAHHQDDLLETAVINLLRGTGRKGLSSMRSSYEIRRPLLHISKQQLRRYAEEHNVKWHEDSTNQDETYLRNYVRHRLLPRLSEADKQRFLKIISQAAQTNEQLDSELARMLPVTANLPKKDIVALSHAEARELMAAWLRRNGLRDFDRNTLERLVVAAKTAAPGKKIDVINKYVMYVGREYLALEHIER